MQSTIYYQYADDSWAGLTALTGWVERKIAKSAVEAALAVAALFELKSTQRLHCWPFVYSDDSIVVLNVKEKA